MKKSNIGLEVKKHRINNNLTQYKLSVLAGVHRNTIAQLELGISSNIGVFTLCKIAKVLGVGIDELLRIKRHAA